MYFVWGILLSMGTYAQIYTPVKWSSEVVGDSVRLCAIPDSGWHITIITINDQQIGEEYYNNYTLTLSEQEAVKVSIRYNACDDNTCTAPEIYRYVPTPEPVTTPDRSLWMIFILGLLGGFLAIFTPCVWPIIPMTVSFFLKQQTTSVKNGILFGLSIIVIYVGLGLLVTILFGASALNAFSTNAIVNLFFFALLVVFALSFFGLFEITLPTSWANKLDSNARNTSGILSVLLMAFTLVIVSFSCTGPIIGTLLVEAAGHSLLAPTIGMFGFALALAIPFTIFSLFPSWLKQMPRSGGWMNVLKVSLAFVELAFSLKFLSVADLAYGWGILPRWLFLTLWILIFLAWGVYLLGGLKKVFPDDGTFHWKGTWTVHNYLRGILAIASLALAVYLIPGLYGSPVKAVAAFAPPQEVTHKDVFYDYDEGMSYARQEGRAVLLDFTGYGCVNCRKMESWVLDNEEVKEHLQRYVQITLYVDDKHPYKDTDMSVGDYNSRLQREQFGSNAQPYLIQLAPNGDRLSEPCVFTTDAKKFLQWLVL